MTLKKVKRRKKVSNWYKNAQSLYQTHDRFYYDVSFSIWVPEGATQEDGWQILTEKLNKMVEQPEINSLGMDAKIRVEYIKQA